MKKRLLITLIVFSLIVTVGREIKSLLSFIQTISDTYIMDFEPFKFALYNNLMVITGQKNLNTV